MAGIVPFAFQLDESVEIRTICNELGDPWFVLRDLLSSMKSSTTVTAAKSSIEQALGEGHIKNIPIVDSLGRINLAAFVSESALVFILLRSGKKSVSTLTVKAILSQVKDVSSILKALKDFEVPDDIDDMYVYAIREKNTGNIKLGISRCPERRLRDLQTGNSSQLELVASCLASNRFKDEKKIHFNADAFKVRGEWFSEEAIAYLQ